jgi:hypothetical protein
MAMTAHISPLAEPILTLLQGQLSSLILSHAPPHSVIEEQYLLSQLGLKLQTDRAISADLLLFQRHFVLYHLLYRLQHSFLTQQQGYLRIDLARVQYLPMVDAPELTSDAGRREYYLNWQHYYAMTEQLLDDHLSAFWHSVSQRQPVADNVSIATAINLLALTPGFSLPQLKKAYRIKALQLHPDRGGDQQQFILLRQAYQQLLQQF